MRKRGSEGYPQRGWGRRRGPPDILTIIVEGSDKVRDQPVGHGQELRSLALAKRCGTRHR